MSTQLRAQKLRRKCLQLNAGPPRLARPPRPESCLEFGFQHALIRNNRSKNLGYNIGPCLAQICRGGPEMVAKNFPCLSLLTVTHVNALLQPKIYCQNLDSKTTYLCISHHYSNAKILSDF